MPGYGALVFKSRPLSIEIRYYARVSFLEDQESRSYIFNLFLGCVNVLDCVAKNHLGYKNTECYFSSGSNLEELGHESSLPANVAFPDSFNLYLPEHVHDLIPANGPPRRFDVGFIDAVGAIGWPQMRA